MKKSSISFHRYSILFFLFITSIFSEVKFLTLKDSLNIAIENNLRLKSKKEEIKQAEYEKKIAKSYFFPQITSNFVYTRLNESEEISLFPGSFKIMEKNIYNFTLTLKQPIFTGYKIHTNYEKSKINLEKVWFQFDEELQKIIFEVKKGYFSILKAKPPVGQLVNTPSLKLLSLSINAPSLMYIPPEAINSNQ